MSSFAGIFAVPVAVATLMAAIYLLIQNRLRRRDSP